MLTVLIDGQKQYGKEYSLKATLDYFRLKLEKKYTVDQVMFALDEYTDKKNDIPSPADINNILVPEPVCINQSEYIAALNWLKNQGYPICIEAEEKRNIIKDYERQEEKSRDDFKIENDKIAQIVSGSVKRIT